MYETLEVLAVALRLAVVVAAGALFLRRMPRRFGIPVFVVLSLSTLTPISIVNSIGMPFRDAVFLSRVLFALPQFAPHLQELFRMIVPYAMWNVISCLIVSSAAYLFATSVLYGKDTLPVPRLGRVLVVSLLFFLAASGIALGINTILIDIQIPVDSPMREYVLEPTLADIAFQLVLITCLFSFFCFLYVYPAMIALRRWGLNHYGWHFAAVIVPLIGFVSLYGGGATTWIGYVAPALIGATAFWAKARPAKAASTGHRTVS